MEMKIEIWNWIQELIGDQTAIGSLIQMFVCEFVSVNIQREKEREELT